MNIVNNYIRINNIRVSQQEIQKLPTEIIESIEKFLLANK
ncbi:hypothetical protein CLV82_2531 [Zeaxanthinibacter enoshimensis]|uniref:Uncharacterized protein n=1 Tax=Zeaxanthinibacter enoshimensis TaxID=392009 RepID=A0A4R6TLP7_9FLAO|nr:hypothetical protein CLV82_2531 [Zeaxanthinibacter enoshimensis]